MAAVCLFLGMVLLCVLLYRHIILRCSEDGCHGKLVRMVEEKPPHKYQDGITRITFLRCTENPSHECEHRIKILPIPRVKQQPLPTPKPTRLPRKLLNKMAAAAHAATAHDRIRKIFHGYHW